MSIEIIPIEEKHADGFNACLDRVAKEKQFLAFQEAPSIESSRKFVRENVETGQVQLVAMDRNKVIGWCDILRPSLATFRHTGTLGMGILKEFRGNGIGRRMLATAIQKSFESGIERIELTVFESNKNAIALYHSAGFVEEGRMVRKAKIDTDYYDIFCMAKFREA